MFIDKPVTKGVLLSSTQLVYKYRYGSWLSAGLPVSVVVRGLTISSVCVYDKKECGWHLAMFCQCQLLQHVGIEQVVLQVPLVLRTAFVVVIICSFDSWMRSDELKAFFYCSKFPVCKRSKSLFSKIQLTILIAVPEACEFPVHIIWKVLQMIELQLQGSCIEKSTFFDLLTQEVIYLKTYCANS